MSNTKGSSSWAYVAKIKKWKIFLNFFGLRGSGFLSGLAGVSGILALFNGGGVEPEISSEKKNFISIEIGKNVFD